MAPSTKPVNEPASRPGALTLLEIKGLKAEILHDLKEECNPSPLEVEGLKSVLTKEVKQDIKKWVWQPITVLLSLLAFFGFTGYYRLHKLQEQMLEKASNDFKSEITKLYNVQNISNIVNDIITSQTQRLVEPQIAAFVTSYLSRHNGAPILGTTTTVFRSDFMYQDFLITQDGSYSPEVSMLKPGQTFNIFKTFTSPGTVTTWPESIHWWNSQSVTTNPTCHRVCISLEFDGQKINGFFLQGSSP